jgi:hypothetical protein
MKQAFRRAVESRGLTGAGLKAAGCDAALAAAVSRLEDVIERARNVRIALITGERDVSLLMSDLNGAVESTRARVAQYDDAVGRLIATAAGAGCHDLWDDVVDELCAFEEEEAV